MNIYQHFDNYVLVGGVSLWVQRGVGMAWHRVKDVKDFGRGRFTYELIGDDAFANRNITPSDRAIPSTAVDTPPMIWQASRKATLDDLRSEHGELVYVLLPDGFWLVEQSSLPSVDEDNYVIYLRGKYGVRTAVYKATTHKTALSALHPHWTINGVYESADIHEEVQRDYNATSGGYLTRYSTSDLLDELNLSKEYGQEDLKPNAIQGMMNCVESRGNFGFGNWLHHACNAVRLFSRCDKSAVSEPITHKAENGMSESRIRELFVVPTGTTSDGKGVNLDKALPEPPLSVTTNFTVVETPQIKQAKQATTAIINMMRIRNGEKSCTL